METFSLQESLSGNNLSFTWQVIRNGTATGRPVDLRQLKGYEELIHGLDQMFNFGGNLIDGSSGWHVKCMDDDGDDVPIGDYTWQLRTLSLL